VATPLIPVRRSAKVEVPTGKRPDLRTEKTLLRGGIQRLATMDEVGRGSLAGPVSIGVVVVTPSIGRVPPGLRDSKLLTPAARTALVTPIRRWVREYAVGHATSDEIDDVGIIGGLRLAALRALAQLDAVDAILLDGNYNYLLGSTEVPVHTRIKADLTCAGVSAASVLAKTERDAMMVELHPAHPPYGFAENKGYSTPEHIEALRTHGPSAAHRQSWRLPGVAYESDDTPAMFGI
jgi:ribonuclease HII